MEAKLKTITLTQQERSVIEEAYAPFQQALVIVAKLRGLNPATTILSNDHLSFMVPDDQEQE